MSAGPPVGNTNASDGKAWRLAIRKALAHKHGTASDGLFAIARKLVEAAENGDQWAIRELGDREDGKAAQSVTVAGDRENPLTIQAIERIIVDPAQDTTR